MSESEQIRSTERVGQRGEEGFEGKRTRGRGGELRVLLIYAVQFLVVKPTLYREEINYINGLVN